MRKIVFLFLFLFVLFFIGYQYIYQDHKNINATDAHFSFVGSEFLKKFDKSPEDATVLYLDKVVKIEGDITDIFASYIVIDKRISCYFEHVDKNALRTNQTVIIKGRCLGYDSLLEEIKLDQCVLVETNKPD